MIARVGRAMERLAGSMPGRTWWWSAMAARSARRWPTRSASGADNALHLSVQNLSLTRLERHAAGWRVVCVNQLCTATEG